MQKKRIIPLFFLIIFTVVVLVASAASISGVFSFGRGSIIMNGKLKNLTSSVKTTLTASVTVNAVCVQRGHDDDDDDDDDRPRRVLGSNRIVLTYSATVNVNPDSHGKANVRIEICDPGQWKASCNYAVPSPSSLIHPTAKQAGCPYGKWRVAGFDPATARWGSTSVAVKQGVTVALQENFTCADTGTSLKCASVDDDDDDDD